ncbi:hypothetical protein BMETH_590_1 [methanotrophic bacterial endosymbiont of Bathymodiolus sp.]|nr:hypothetical protein BMETH_590_1 [methanotrophic bacterial endosymbiont of Bathymodiolus sp.]
MSILNFLLKHEEINFEQPTGIQDKRAAQRKRVNA